MMIHGGECWQDLWGRSGRGELFGVDTDVSGSWAVIHKGKDVEHMEVPPIPPINCVENGGGCCSNAPKYDQRRGRCNSNRSLAMGMGLVGVGG